MPIGIPIICLYMPCHAIKFHVKKNLTLSEVQRYVSDSLLTRDITFALLRSRGNGSISRTYLKTRKNYAAIKILITQQLQTDVGRSVDVATTEKQFAILLCLSERF